MRKFVLILILIFTSTGIPVYAESCEDRISAIENSLEELNSLFLRCEQEGYDTSYETADFAIIKDFIDYARQDILWGDTERASYVADCLEQLYADTKDSLEKYLSKQRNPIPTSKNYAQDYAGTSNGDFINKYGNTIIYNGYGVFDKVKNDTEKLQDFGADIMQIEIGPNSVLSQIGTINGWSADLYENAQASAELYYENDISGNCLKIVNETPKDANGYIAVRQYVAVRPNTSYTLSMDAKTVNASRTFFSPQGWTANRCYLDDGTTQWKNYSATYTTSDDEYMLEIMIVSNKAAEGIYIDNITLCEDTDKTNIIQNGDFEDSDGIVSEHFQANPAQIRNRVTRVLDRAYDSGIMVNLLISPHYFPDWILTQYPETTVPDCGLGYDINNPIIREALELYIQAVMQEVKSHPALHSICLTNEPNCDTRKTSGLDDEFCLYLISIYDNNINELNSVYKTNYSSFWDVRMPQSDTMDAAYYDWVQFNNQYVKNWHKFLSDAVKKYAPNVPVHIKMMTIFGKADSLNFGVDPEDMAEITDYNGNDAWGFLGNDASGLISKLMWYDLLNSIKPDAPIINSEDHITEDRNENYTPKQAIHSGADIWQGAVHGRDASIIWIWARSQDKTSDTYGNILYRPDVLSQVSRTSLDLNRLAEYVAALQKAESRVSILYSPTTRAYQSNAVSVMKLAYTAAMYSGANPRFITERQLENGTKPNGVLVVPMVSHISDEAWQTVAEFERSGGIIITIGNNCFCFDNHNNARNINISSDINVELTFNNNIVISPDSNELSDILCEYTQTKKLRDFQGDVIPYIDKVEVEYNGKTLWNLCNYSWEESKTAVIDGTAIDLISGRKFTGSVILDPFEPVLLEFIEPEFNVSAQLTEDAGICCVCVQLNNDADIGGYIEADMIVNTISEKAIEKVYSKKYVAAAGGEYIEFRFPMPGEDYYVKMFFKTDSGQEIGDIVLYN